MGVADGIADGAVDGDSEGETVGDTVGDSVGDTVGDIVGMLMPTTVAASKETSPLLTCNPPCSAAVIAIVNVSSSTNVSRTDTLHTYCALTLSSAAQLFSSPRKTSRDAFMDSANARNKSFLNCVSL